MSATANLRMVELTEVLEVRFDHLVVLVRGEIAERSLDHWDDISGMSDAWAEVLTIGKPVSVCERLV